MANAVRLPSKESLEKCFDIITSNESAEYLSTRLQEQVSKAGVKGQLGSFIGDIKAYADAKGDTSADAAAWTGVLLNERSSFQNYQSVVAQNSSELFSNRNIRFDFAISDDAEILRGYSIDGEMVSEEEAEQLDKLYNAWLAEQGMLTQSGVIYEATSDGKIKQENNKDKRANVERLRDLISDKNKGFAQYAKAKNDSLTVETVGHEHPAQKAAGEEHHGPS